MELTFLDLCCFFLIYAFLGWAVEVLVILLRDRQLRNRGFFNLPFCLSYGLTMVFLIILFSYMQGMIVRFITAVVVSAVVTFLSGSLSRHISGHTLWKYQENNLFMGERWPALLGLVQGFVFLTVYMLLHPLLYLLIAALPWLLKLIVCAVIAALLLVDLIFILLAMRKCRTQEEVDAAMARLKARKSGYAATVSSLVWRRLTKAYPNLVHEPREKPAGFARGICFDKLVWVFFVTALLGDIIETFFVRFSSGVWMSRSSLVYGPFSVVWGFGAVILTVVLQKLAEREDRYVFLAGCLIGGIYEYTCSVATEVLFGTTFWDYSDMPLNFGGRTNLLYCLFWGILAVIWLKKLFPFIGRQVERIPPMVGKILTWIILIAFILDGILSAAVLLRYMDRMSDPTVQNFVTRFLDSVYPDSLVERIWPDMHF